MTSRHPHRLFSHICAVDSAARENPTRTWRRTPWRTILDTSPDEGARLRSRRLVFGLPGVLGPTAHYLNWINRRLEGSKIRASGVNLAPLGMSQRLASNRLRALWRPPVGGLRSRPTPRTRARGSPACVASLSSRVFTCIRSLSLPDHLSHRRSGWSGGAGSGRGVPGGESDPHRTSGEVLSLDVAPDGTRKHSPPSISLERGGPPRFD